MRIPILPRGQSALGLLGKSLGTGIGGGLQESLQTFHKNQQIEESQSAFEEQGYPSELARLAAVATTGGQTEILKHLLEMQQRGTPLFEKFEEIKEAGPHREKFEELQEKVPGGEKLELSEEVGLTPKERVKREGERFQKQGEKYSELTQKVEKLDQEKIRIQRLQELNERENLPKGLGRVNVNLKSGELVLPFGATPDSQEFIKIVNDFLSGAKETFGARITNFEVNRFLKRLPSLLNTEEGRRRVLRQMEILNEMNTLHSEGILNEFDSSGGVRKLDFDEAIRRSRQKNKNKFKDLQKEYVTGGSPEQEGRGLTQEIAIEILRQAQGDKEKARKIAKKRGYEL